AETVWKVKQDNPYDNNQTLKALSQPWPQNCCLLLDLIIPGENDNTVKNDVYLKVTNLNFQLGLNKITESTPYYINLNDVTLGSNNFTRCKELYLQTFSDGESSAMILPTSVYLPNISCVLAQNALLPDGTTTISDKLSELNLQLENCDVTLQIEGNYDVKKTLPNGDIKSENINLNQMINLKIGNRNNSYIVAQLNDLYDEDNKFCNDNLPFLLPPVGAEAKFSLLLTNGSKKIVLKEETKSLKLNIDGQTVLEYYGLP
ncbi:unnamed protein product, partial [marine sediment metagenome]